MKCAFEDYSVIMSSQGFYFIIIFYFSCFYTALKPPTPHFYWAKKPQVFILKRNLKTQVDDFVKLAL